MLVNCQKFVMLDYEFLLERKQKVTLYSGTTGTIVSLNKPFVTIKTESCNECVTTYSNIEFVEK